MQGISRRLRIRNYGNSQYVLSWQAKGGAGFPPSTKGSVVSLLSNQPHDAEYSQHHITRMPLEGWCLSVSAALSNQGIYIKTLPDMRVQSLIAGFSHVSEAAFHSASAQSSLGFRAQGLGLNDLGAFVKDLFPTTR